MQPSPLTSRASAELRAASKSVDVVITLAIRQPQTTAKLDQSWMPPR
jgi:hypothetical protein